MGRSRPGRPRLLTIQAWSAFTVNGSDEPRWNTRVVADNVIKGATAAVLGEGRTSRTGTDPNEGKTTVDIGRLNGRYKLRLAPAAGQVSVGPAGPATNAGGAERMYRVLDIILNVRDGVLQMSPAPAVAPGMTHGRVRSVAGDFIEVDWKPDWVRAHRVGPRPPRVVANAIVLHRTDAPTIGSTLSNFITKPVNAHYVVDVDGHVVKMVFEADQASHAGPGAQWRGEQPVNAFSVGIEIVNDGGRFPAPQMTGSIRLIQELMEEFRIPRRRVLAHCEVHPLKPDDEDPNLLINARLPCPGPDFDWPMLEKLRLAATPFQLQVLRRYEHFFEEFPNEALVFRNSDRGSRYGRAGRTHDGYLRLITTLQSDLQDIGYEGVPPEEVGEYGIRTVRIVERFQARYFTGNRSPSGHPRRPKFGEVDRGTASAIRGVWYDRERP
jgi:N-acetyl-anhydromuramyl-L-alanine amidase AmpD